MAEFWFYYRTYLALGLVTEVALIYSQTQLFRKDFKLSDLIVTFGLCMFIWPLAVVLMGIEFMEWLQDGHDPVVIKAKKDE